MPRLTIPRLGEILRFTQDDTVFRSRVARCPLNINRTRSYRWIQVFAPDEKRQRFSPEPSKDPVGWSLQFAQTQWPLKFSLP